MRAAPAPRRIADMIRTLTIGPNRSLGLHLDGASPLAGPWLDQAADAHRDTDVAVVGGGIAGLSAALAAAQAGERVLLLERRATPGGDAKFFGAVEGEDAPDAVIKRLLETLGRMPNVTMLTGTEAFAIAGRTLRAHSIEIIDGAPAGQVLAAAFKRLVLANGVIERLPVFPGNRMPGVTGALEAYHRGVRYGVWQGQSALFNTAVSVAYRLAMLASDAGITIERITDTRTQPQSRFLEFSKAYGIRLVRGLAPASVTAAPSRQAGVLVHLAPTFEGVVQQVLPIWTELLVTSGGWQPDLGLWFMAGGQCRWQAATARLEAVGVLEGVGLAGSAAGYRNSSACAQSGEAAVARLLGHPVSDIEDPQIDPIYESPDAINAIPAEHAEGLAYLDGGESLALRPGVSKPGHTLPMLARRRPSAGALADQPRALSISDLASAVQVGIIPQSEAAAVARERCVVAVDIVAHGQRHVAPPAPAPVATGSIPSYLAGRFGDQPEIWVVAAEQARGFEPGCLLHLNSETAHPLAAVGVVIGAISEPEATPLVAVLLGKPQATAGNRLFIRDISGATPVKLVERFVPGRPAPEAMPHPVAEPAEEQPAVRPTAEALPVGIADQPTGTQKFPAESAPSS